MIRERCGLKYRYLLRNREMVKLLKNARFEVPAEILRLKAFDFLILYKQALGCFETQPCTIAHRLTFQTACISMAKEIV